MCEWLEKNPSPIFFERRHDLYQYINDTLIDDQPIDYLEFGVSKGTTLTQWLKLNKNKESRFFGFDTFEGLPESFDLIRHMEPKGSFTNYGECPKIEDSRLSFIKGLFQEKLPKFLNSYVPKNRLIIYNDSDLYTSSLYILTRLNDLLKAGSIIIFDEFFCSSHEFQAFYDYYKSFHRSYKVVGARHAEKNKKLYTQIAIEME